jgi:hypothetical protein
VFLLAVHGVPLLIRGAPPNFRMTDEALRSLPCENRPINIWFDCRTEIVVAPCEHCFQSSTVFEVRKPSDAENALALLGLDGERQLREGFSR